MLGQTGISTENMRLFVDALRANGRYMSSSHREVFKKHVYETLKDNRGEDWLNAWLFREWLFLDDLVLHLIELLNAQIQKGSGPSAGTFTKLKQELIKKVGYRFWLPPFLRSFFSYLQEHLNDVITAHIENGKKELTKEELTETIDRLAFGWHTNAEYKSYSVKEFIGDIRLPLKKIVSEYIIITNKDGKSGEVVIAIKSKDDLYTLLQKIKTVGEPQIWGKQARFKFLCALVIFLRNNKEEALKLKDSL